MEIDEGLSLIGVFVQVLRCHKSLEHDSRGSKCAEAVSIGRNNQDFVEIAGENPPEGEHNSVGH